VVFRSFIDDETPDPEIQGYRRSLRPWLVEVGAAPELEPWEDRVVSQALGRLDARTKIEGTWACEGLAVLAWALRRFELPRHDLSVEPTEVTAALEFMQPAATELAGKVTSRSWDDIRTRAKTALTVHWRIQKFLDEPVAADLVHLSKTSWYGQFSLEGVALAKSDLAIGGVPISRASAEAVHAAASIALERHRAFNWLMGYEGTYSSVDTTV